IEINAAIRDQFLQPDHVRLMGDMHQRPAEYLLRRLDLGERHQFPAQFPPGPGGLELAMEQHAVRPDALNRAFQADVMNQAPRLAAKIAGHAEGVVQYLGNTCHDWQARTRRAFPRDTGIRSSLRRTLTSHRGEKITGTCPSGCDLYGTSTR